MTRSIRSHGACLACTTLAWALAVLPAAAAPDGFTIGVDGFGQPVGMAADTYAGRYWITDGKEATTSSLVAVDNQGKVHTRVTWAARPKDVQALAWSKGRLYVGDIGDADQERDHVQVLSPTSLDQGRSSWKAWDLVYPDGPHDAGALAISGKGNFYIVTRGSSPGIYRAPNDLSRGSDNPLTKVADAPQGVTDATFLPDGGRLAMRTDAMVYVVDAYSWKTTASAVIAPRGGHAMTTDIAGKGLEIGGQDQQVGGVDIPTTVTSATPTPTPPPAPEKVEGSDTNTSKSRSGTFTALLGALGLAVVAGLVTAFHGLRRR